MIKMLAESELKLRDSLIPRTWYDRFVTLFVFWMIPIVYWFELWVVLPEFYRVHELWYLTHFALGNFILFNILSNFLALLAIDTSIRAVFLKPSDDWRFCSPCETLVPPRSWHCDTCDTCILKRDHHCVFSGCCVGHNNLRYFIFFVFYIFVATFYSCYFNFYYIWYNVELFASWTSLLKLVFPLAALVYEYKIEQAYLFLTVIVLISCLFTGVLLYFHVSLMLKGMVTHQRRTKEANKYDLGVEENIKEVLGVNWRMTWLSALIQSPLPHDGQAFPEKRTLKAE